MTEMCLSVNNYYNTLSNNWKFVIDKTQYNCKNNKLFTNYRHHFNLNEQMFCSILAKNEHTFHFTVLDSMLVFREITSHTVIPEIDLSLNLLS